MPEIQVPVRITGKHPHSGATGYVTYIDGKTETVMGDMVRVTLDDPNLGVEGCFAAENNLRRLPPGK